MSKIKLESGTKVLWGIIWISGFLLIGFGIGLLLNLILPVVLISIGVGIIFLVVFLIYNKFYEIENQNLKE